MKDGGMRVLRSNARSHTIVISTIQKKARNRFPNRAPKFCLLTPVEYLANDASTAMFHDITTDQQGDECNKAFHDWRVHEVVINRARHDDR
jgi:hypothetical protein